ncbi:MAG: hypothetical protein K9G64_03295 [Bacteroidia bacterium]|nr:hypothetical protein [Bacteroidia bacterium]
MNSIQLISKINSRIEDLAMLSQEILKPNGDLSTIEKEVIKRNCSDLYELVLKLKTSNDLSDEQLALKENLSQEIRNELSFKEFITNSLQDDASINTIAESKLQEPIFEEEMIAISSEPMEDITLENMHPIGEILDEIKEDFQQPFIEEMESIIIESETFETLISEPIIEEESVVFEAEIVEESIDFPIENPIEEITISQTVISPPKLDVPVFETKLVNEEQKEKPAAFFSIGKTVMPKTEPSLNEKIAQNLDGFQLSEQVIEPKIDNLKTAISLNKKIAFVNELFKENVVEYAKSIDKINSSNNISEAMLIWTELKITHNWNNENHLVKDLEKLIQRRFS